MSAGQAVTMPEGSFPSITKSPLVFGSSDSDSQGRNSSVVTESSVPVIEAEKSCSGQSNAALEKPMKHGDSADVINCNSSHLILPSKMKDVNSDIREPDIRKTKTLHNDIQQKLTLSVGASGDGLSANDKIVLLTHKPKADFNHRGEPLDKRQNDIAQLTKTVTKQSNKPKQPLKTTGQTYAKAAQGFPLHTKSDRHEKHAQASETSTGNASDHTGSMVNGCLLDSEVSDSEKVSSVNEIPNISDSKQKALRETIGHAARYADGTSKSNEGKCSEQDNDITKAGNFLGETQEPSSLENSGSTADGDSSLSSKPNNAPPRRETEKPPRMQKQRSQDRILPKQRNSFDSDTKRENLSRDPSCEILDSTGVDVQEFLVNVLRTCVRDRTILLKIEHDMTSFVHDKTIDFMKFPPMSSYHRMLVHRVATFFCLDHNVDETGKCVIINKTSFTRVPDMKFGDQFDPRQCDPSAGRREDDMRRSILKRSNQSRSFDRDDRGGSWKDRQMSIEEREENYEKTRARIFNESEANMNPASVYGRRGVSPMQARLAYGERRSNSGGAELENGIRMSNQDTLTTRASSYSTISVLPRNSSYPNSKTGSSSSMSSLNSGNGRIRGYGKTRHHMNIHPRPPTPNRRDGGGSTYYYMQNQNQGLPYLSPEGYQLVYPSGIPGSNGIPSQYSRYYQMAPPPTRPHPGMGYPQGYNAYDESAQKVQGMNNTDYTVVPPSYPPTMAAVTTTVYSGVQGQPNVNYAYQPAIFRPPGDPAMVTNSAQMMQAGPPQQGKQTPVMPANQGLIQQPMSNSNYPPQFMVGAPANPSGGQLTVKDVSQPINAPNSNPQRNVIAQSALTLPPGCPKPVTFNQASVNSAPAMEQYRQGAAKDQLTSNSSQKSVKDELGEKMNAIVLKNMQQQQQSQVSEASKSDPKSTVTNAVSPNMTSASNAKRGQEHTQSLVASDVAVNNQIGQSGRPIHKNPGYPYQYANGMQQQQQMQIYMMPSNNPPGNSSYQAYPQYMAQHQPQHVMSPGMHLVYLSPPVVGMDASNPNLPSPANVHMYHPSQLPQQQMHPSHPPYESPRGYMSNMNNNNAASVAAIGAAQGVHGKNDNASSSNKQDDVGADATSSISSSTSAKENEEISKSDHVDNINEVKTVVTYKSNAGTTEASQSDVSRIAQQGEVRPSETGQPSSANTPHASNAATPIYMSHNHPVTPQHPGAPLLVSNIAQDYRFAGMNMAGPVPYPAGVIPKYPMYPSLAPAMYLPAALQRNAKLPDMKMYQAQPSPQHSPGIVAVQLPNQNSIQLVQAPSIQQSNAVYYTPPNYVTTEFSHPVPAPQTPNMNSASERVPQYDLPLQKSANNSTEQASSDTLKSAGDSKITNGPANDASNADIKLNDDEGVAGKE